jgi:uncharacterized lipoprotein YbaY
MSRTLAAALISLALLAVLGGCAAPGGPAAAPGPSAAPGGPATAQSDAPQKISIKGSLTYPARITLPPEARAVVELKDTSVTKDRVVAELRMDLQGKQVPIPFELTVDPAKLVAGRPYSVRGAFFLRGRATWVSDPVVITPTAGASDVGALVMKPYTTLAFAEELQCGERKVSIGFVGDVMRLTVGGQSFDMHPVASASGSKYEALRDPSTTLWIKGTEATVTIKGATYPTCRSRGSETATVPHNG